MTACTLVKKTVARSFTSMDIWSLEIAGEEIELSQEQKYKSKNEALEQMTDCNSMRNVLHLLKDPFSTASFKEIKSS